MNLAHPLLSAILCGLIIEAVLFAAGKGSIPAEWVPYVIMAANTAAVVVLWWLVETVKELASGTAPKSAPVDGGKPIEPPGPLQPPAKPPVEPPAAGSDFDRCVAVTLRPDVEGGNDKADGTVDRTSRGIEQIRDWDVWRSTHPGLPADVFDAPLSEIKAIHKANYWNPLLCDSLPNGVDLCVFDDGVLSGIGEAARVLQRLVGTDQDGEVGPLTIAAAAAIDPVSLVGRLCDARQAYYDGLYQKNPARNAKYIHGWTNRVTIIRTAALALAAEAPRPKVVAPPTASIPTGAVSGAAIIAIVTSLDGEHWTSGNNPTINGWIEEIAAKWPDRAAYARTLENHGYFAWCGLTCAYVMTKAGFKPPSEFYAAVDWLNFGTKVTIPQPGDVLIYQWGDGSHHVSIYDQETDGDYYASHGGNQSHTVNVTKFPMASCIGIRRPA